MIDFKDGDLVSIGGKLYRIGLVQPEKRRSWISRMFQFRGFWSRVWDR